MKKITLLTPYERKFQKYNRELKEVFSTNKAYTTNIYKACLLLFDGSLIKDGIKDRQGDFDEFVIDRAFPKMTRSQLQDTFSFVKLIPKLKTAILGKKQKLSKPQKQRLATSGYRLVRW